MPRRTASRLTAALKGVAALAVLAALLVVVPVLLWQVGTLPHQVPGWGDVTAALTAPDSGSLFLGALTLLGWAGWLSFAASTLVEVAALLRHRRAPRVRALGATQRLAATLVAGVAMLLPAGAAFAAPQTASAAPVSVTAPAAVGASTTATSSPATAPDAQTGPVHHVVAGDTLWDLAQHYLGSGTRWHDIADLNPQIKTGDLLQPGTVLHLPAEARETPEPTAPAPAPETVPPAGHTVTVQSGDTLSALAEKELGDGDKYPQLLEASKEVRQPGGRHLTDADQLFPGDVIVIPGPATAAPATPAQEPAPAPAADVPAPAATTSAPATADTPSPTPNRSAPDASEPASPAAAAPAAPTTPTAASQSAEPVEATTDDARSPLSVQQGIGGVAALLGAGALAVIAARRRAQQRERRPGEQIAVPQETSQAEMVLDRTSSPVLVDLLDRALRTLAHHHPEDLPQIVGARVQQDRVEILVEDTDAEALTPFNDRPGGWWGVRGDRAVLLDAEEARTVPAPYPGLATIGTAEDNTLLLADLHQARVLLLDGDEQNVREVARGIAMEAGTALWSDHTEIMTAGFGLELQQLLPACRTMFVPRLATATADLARVMVELHQAEHEGGERPLPWMVVCSTVPSPDELYEFADVIGKVPAEVRVAAILPAAGQARDLFPDAEVLDANLVTELQSLESLDAEVVLQRVSDEVYRQLTADLTTAAQPATSAEGAWALVPDPDRKAFGPSSLTKGNTAPRRHLSPLATQEEVRTTSKDERQEDMAVEAAGEETVLAVTVPIQATDALPAPEAAPPLRADAVGQAEESVPAQAEGPVDTAGSPAEEASVEAAAPVLTKVPPRVSVVREGDAPVPAAGSAPQVQVLGPLRITGIGDAPIQPKLVLLAALLLFKSDRGYGAIANNMDPVSPWTQSTMDTHMSRLRRRLGVDSNGEAYLRPKPKGVEQYVLSEEVTCDYATFSYLAQRGLPHNAAGVLDLEAALDLVRGRPFGGAGAHTWAAPLVQTMVGQIVDTAHAVATLRIQNEILDIEAARRAVAVGLDVEPAAEVLYRSWMRIEQRAGNQAGVRAVIDQVRQMTVEMGWDGMLQDETEQLIARLTAKPTAQVR
ncbi:LysM peptidoglycan-binding domain-containing protein [Kitasatospora sp. NPDC059146]|uniref:LysM peptidoglycan-binding domain-containing protein n=1 Tax=unclassified Kitasatospora TaxID=2633591 RepID=UPI0036B84C36